MINKDNFFNIKMFVFDLDGTLYADSFYKKDYYEFALKYLSIQQNMTIDKAKKVLLDNGIYPYKSVSDNSITKLFIEIGFDIKRWNSERNLFFSKINFSKAERISADLLKKLSEKYLLILLTVNTKITTLKILQELSIDINLFTEIITIETFNEHNNILNKQSTFLILSEKYSLKYSEMMAIGDRYMMDIKPLEILGGHGLLVQSPKDIEDFFIKNNFVVGLT